jgi:hypothetical protein
MGGRAPGPEGGAYLRLVVLGALIGIPAALLAAGFLGLVHYAEQWLWHDLPAALGAPSPPLYLLGVSPTLAIVVGTAAGMAAQTRLLVSPLVFAALLAGKPGVDAVPAAVLASAAAWLTATALSDPRLRRPGFRLPRRPVPPGGRRAPT